MEDLEAVKDDATIDLVALDEALAKLATYDPPKVRVVELKFLWAWKWRRLRMRWAFQLAPRPANGGLPRPGSTAKSKIRSVRSDFKLIPGSDGTITSR